MGMGLVITLITIITVYNNLLVFDRQLRKFKSFLGHSSKKKRRFTTEKLGHPTCSPSLTALERLNRTPK